MNFFALQVPVLDVAYPLLPLRWHSSTITLLLPHICFPTLSHSSHSMLSFSSPNTPNSFLPQGLCKTCSFCLFPFSLTGLALTNSALGLDEYTSILEKGLPWPLILYFLMTSIYFLDNHYRNVNCVNYTM